MMNLSDEIKHNELPRCLPDKIYIHVSGISGTFLERTLGRFGKMIIIKTPDGREFFAPENEFKIVRK